MSWTTALDFHYAWPHSVCGTQHTVLTRLLPASFHEYITKQERQCRYKCSIEVYLCNCCFCGKAISTNVCLTIVIQHAKRMHCVTHIVSSLARLTVPHFSTLSYIWHNFLKKLLNIKFFL
jgi:hypothetical protein